MAFEFTDAEKLKISAITGGQGGLAVLTSKLGLDVIPSNAVENDLQRWIKYIEADSTLKNMAYNSRDADGSWCHACINKKNEFDRNGSYGPIKKSDYYDSNGNIDQGTLNALRASVVGYGHYQEYGKKEGRQLSPIIPDLPGKLEQIRTSLNNFELNSVQKKNQMFARFPSLTGFNQWNRLVDRFKKVFNKYEGNISDSAAHAFVSVNTKEVTDMLKSHAEHENEIMNSSGSVPGWTMRNEFSTLVSEMLTESNGEYVVDSGYKMDEITEATTPYNFDENSRYFGSVASSFDENGHRVETDSYHLASENSNWHVHSKLGWMANVGEPGWHYTADFGWIFMDDAGMEDNYMSDGWIWSAETGQWMWPVVGGADGQSLYFGTKGKGKDDKPQYISVGLGDELGGHDNTYYVHDGEQWSKVGDGSTPGDLVKERLDLTIDPEGFLDAGNKITDEVSSFAKGGSWLENKLDDIEYEAKISDLEYDQYMDGVYDNVAQPISSVGGGSSALFNSGIDESRGDIADTISYDIEGYGVDAALITSYQSRLNEIARDMRYKGVNQGLIPSLIKRTDLYKDLMDSLGGSDASEAGSLVDDMVRAAAEKTAQDGTVAKNLDMFDSRGGGMLDPMMNLQEKYAVRTAKPSRYATADDVANGYADKIGQLINNPDYDPSLSYYFEYRNPETGKLETRAFRPDMAGKQPFMENQERLIDGANMVIDDQLDEILNRGEDGMSNYERKLNKTIDLLKTEGLIAKEGGDDLYTKEGIKALNYIFGDDEDSYTGKREDYNQVNKFLRGKQNYYEGLAAQEGLDKSAKLMEAIEDTAPVENARQRATERMKLARFGGTIGSGNTLFENSLTPKVNPVNLDNITGKDKLLYNDETLKELGIKGGLGEAPVMSNTLKGNQYAKNLILPGNE